MKFTTLDLRMFIKSLPEANEPCFSYSALEKKSAGEILKVIEERFGRPMSEEIADWRDADMSAKYREMLVERKNLKEERRALHKSAMAGVALRVTGHDFNGWLGGALGALKRLPAEVQDDLNLQAAKNLLGNFIDIYGDFWQIKGGKAYASSISAKNIVDFCKKCVHWNTMEKVTFVGFDDESWSYNAQTAVIYPAVMNLIDNASRHYKPQAPDEKAQIHVELHGKSLFVIDNGMGVPEEHVEKMWDLGYSTKDPMHREDAGVGLFICKSRLEACGNSIHYHSSKPPVVKSQLNGACFEIRLK